MLYFLLFVAVATLIMIYLQMRLLIKFSQEVRKKDYLVFSELNITNALNTLESAQIKFNKAQETYDANYEKAKAKYGEKITIKNLEAVLKDYWQAEYEEEDAISSYQAMIEANIAVCMGKITIKKAKLDFNEKFGRYRIFSIMKKIEDRWEETQKEVKKDLKK